MPGQRLLIQYTSDHGLYPGFNEGFRLVEQDEHRHIAFGVRFLKDVCDERPGMKKVIVDQLTTLLPEAAKVFVPPQEKNSAEFWSYGQHSSQIYGFAYQALNRRMKLIGVEIPPAEELMPGPCDFTGLDERSQAVVLKDRSQALLGILVLQLDEAQARDQLGEPFRQFVEELSGVAAVAIETRQLAEAQQRLMDAMIKLLADAIDAKSPYTGGHCERVPQLAQMLLDQVVNADSLLDGAIKIMELTA